MHGAERIKNYKLTALKKTFHVTGTGETKQSKTGSTLSRLGKKRRRKFWNMSLEEDTNF